MTKTLFIAFYEVLLGLKMQGRDDELYTTMFNALRHGVRRKVLRILSKRKLSFTSLLNELEISSSHLTYHLDSLGELIVKDDAMYALSVFGKAAVEMMTNIEDPPRRYFQKNSGAIYKYAFTIILTILVMTSALLLSLVDIQATQQIIMETQEAEIQSLTNELKPLTRFSELDLLVNSNPEIKVASKTLLSYYSSSEYPNDALDGSVILIYVPDNNRVLEVTLMSNVLPDTIIPLSVQKGNALLNESAIIVPEIFKYNDSVAWMSDIVWRKTSQDTSSHSIILSEKGWYTISLVGPIVITKNGEPMIQALQLHTNQWTGTEHTRIWADCRLRYMRNSVSFGYFTAESFELHYPE